MTEIIFSATEIIFSVSETTVCAASMTLSGVEMMTTVTSITVYEVHKTASWRDCIADALEMIGSNPSSIADGVEIIVGESPAIVVAEVESNC
jgi:hypothetical protein